jgi:ABC-2 type transport system permease protein
MAAEGETGIAPLQIESTTIGPAKRMNATDYTLPGYLVMFVFMAAATASESIVRERRNRTLERLLSTSVTRQSIIGGMFCGSAVRGLFQIAILWGVGILVFHVDLGLYPAAVILVSVLMVLASAAFGVMLATFARTERSAASVAVLASLVLAPLGGCWWPLFIVPQWMQFLARVTPHGWANMAFNKLMLFGGTFGTALPEMMAVLGFTVLFGLIAVWRFRARAD